ncbi:MULTISPECIES: glucuronate isomerase [unclassified Bacillus (in: firmicutes)]|uniref:glucuronate isomerase n=1 Tax=unclassified Bacillus (in: firmicutes) TaxID=185979 RepID=UPI00163CEAF8|nr:MULTISPECIES: glucuronate isomerase [unclassified Bacillus (in: firmicutes)]QNH47986.1 glucuronate isomerase [Bacillus sp. PAMC28571]QNK45845.1 glucuronate isomerase [Bacillus sp. PAMC22265]
MSTFLSEDMMLHHESSKVLYHDYAKNMPIYDFHTHLMADDIAVNKKYENMTDIWLNGDHYKWRAMRWLGIEERLITGNASDKEKFLAWAQTVPYTIGNPLYHWSHLELSRYFNINELFSEKNAHQVWDICNERLNERNMSTNGILEKFNVKVVCTTDDPIDTLEIHQIIRRDVGITTRVLPTFRPDHALNIEQSNFVNYIEKLGESINGAVLTYENFIASLHSRIDYFHANGCRMSDHGFEIFPFSPATEQEVSSIFVRALQGKTLSLEDINKFKTNTLLHLSKKYHSLHWTMQLHIGALRNNNTRMFKLTGKDSGYDSMSDFHLASHLNGFLNELDKDNLLPKTIIYNLNPAHNAIVASTIGNFQSSDARAKIQFGSGWWFNDQKDGMLDQMKTLSNIGLLSTFVGMLTDSRSFLSFPRHEYFRRILCDLFGTWIENGELPRDYEFIGKIVKDICYHNAVNYFNIEINETVPMKTNESCSKI